MAIISEKATTIANDTDDAYSRSFFSAEQWATIAQACLDAGYSPDATNAILRSKHTRWFRDVGLVASGVRGAKLVAAFKAYLKKARADVNDMLDRECGLGDEVRALNAKRQVDDLFRRKHKIDGQLRNLGLLR